MVWFCAVGCTKIRENSVSETFKKEMDFRKADPEYTKFKPATAEDAINLFHRHKNLGMPPHLWPEVFVKCAADLPNAELQKFQDWLVNPQGEPTGPQLLQIDRENDALRLQLLKEANARDMPPTIDENYMDVDDEKAPLQPPEESEISSMMVNVAVSDAVHEDFDMVTPSAR